MSDTVLIRVPPKTPTLTKAQLKVAIAAFATRHEHLDRDYSPDIYVLCPRDAADVLLNRIAPPGADPMESSFFQAIGHQNQYEELDVTEKRDCKISLTKLSEAMILLCTRAS